MKYMSSGFHENKINNVLLKKKKKWFWSEVILTSNQLGLHLFSVYFYFVFNINFY